MNVLWLYKHITSRHINYYIVICCVMSNCISKYSMSILAQRIKFLQEVRRCQRTILLLSQIYQDALSVVICIELYGIFTYLECNILKTPSSRKKHFALKSGLYFQLWTLTLSIKVLRHRRSLKLLMIFSYNFCILYSCMINIWYYC